MEMAKCAKCKNLFPKFREPICEACIKEEEHLFESVKEYLRDHPKTTVGEVSEATGVSTKKIFGYLRDGRIEVAEGAGLNCAQCGTSITSGQLCSVCFEKASAQIAGMVNKGQSLNPVKKIPKPGGKVMAIGGGRKK